MRESNFARPHPTLKGTVILSDGSLADAPVKSNGHMTNWSYCWRCGRKISERNGNEINQGYHHRCANDGSTNQDGPKVILEQVS
jgi:hypothetical protein